MRAQFQRGPRPCRHRRHCRRHLQRRGRAPARCRSRGGDQPHRRHLRRRARGCGGGRLPQHRQGRRAHRHAAAPRRAPPHGCHGRLPARARERRHARGMRRARPRHRPPRGGGTAHPDLLLRGSRLHARAPQPRRLPRGRVRGADQAPRHRGAGGGLRRPSLRRGRRPHGGDHHRRARLPHRRQLQHQHHLDPPRQRHRLRRARAGPPPARGRQAHGQARARRKGRARHAARHAQGDQGHGLVHRRVRHRAGVDEHHQHRHHAAARRLRRGDARRRRPRHPRDGHGNRRPRAAPRAHRGGALLPAQAAAFERPRRGGAHPHGGEVDGAR